MKYTTSILTVTLMFSASAFAAKMVTSDEVSSGGYVSLGNIAVTQEGLPTIGDKELSEAADKKCEESNGVKASDCYYRIVDKTGNETNHEDIGLEIFKK
jgi:hypothetical protein